MKKSPNIKRILSGYSDYMSFLTSKSILITGGAGFIGSNLAQALISKGFRVVILDDLSTGLESNVSRGAHFIFGSILDSKLVNELVRDAGVVFHLAARGSVPRSIDQPNETFEVNFKGTLNLLEAVKENKIPLIFSSSSSVYGANKSIPKSEFDWVSPLSPYAASKLAAEGAITAYASSYGIQATIFRFFNVYGRLQRFDHPYAAVIPKWIHQAENKNALTVYGDGNQSRDFTHVTTVTKILIQTINDSIFSQIPINLAFGKSSSLNDILQILRLHYPDLVVNYQLSRPGEVTHSSNLPTRLNSLFSEVNEIPISDGIRDTIAWYRQLNSRIS
jgi:UDP-glucose 4-epimerase